MLVGNCCDRGYTRVVSKEEGFRLAERLRIPFFETSALTGENVTEVSSLSPTLELSCFLPSFPTHPPIHSSIHVIDSECRCLLS